MLEDPGSIEDPERRDIMENIERHYIAAMEYDQLHNQKYELECAKREIERYEWELGVCYGDE